MAKYRNPPVVEVWISFEFEPNEKKREWDLELVRRFIQQYGDDLPKLEAVHEQELKVQETSPNELPKVVGRRLSVQRVRVFNEEKSRVLQVADDEISYHLVRSSEKYPGFIAVRDEALAKLQDYIQVFQPSRVRHAVLHYVDIVQIPPPPGDKIDLADYFVASVDFPEEPYGLIGELAVQVVFKCPVDPGPLFYQLRSLPRTKESDVVQFRLDWQKRCIDVDSLDVDKVSKRLDTAHLYLVECFEKSMTNTTLQLFEPLPNE